MLVTVDNGRAVELRGNPDHSNTHGFLCQKVARYLDRVYHPERLTFPKKRVGPKGKGEFVRISWNEAIDTIATRFQAIAVSKDGPESILPYSYAGTMGKIQGSSLDRRFFHLLGASLLDRTICATAGMAGCDLTLGTRAFVDPETVIHSRVIVNWGSNTSVTNSHLWRIMHEARKLGATIISIDPYQCKTAARSDWWLPIRPGTDAALALGIMHIIWREGWHDQDYLDRYCLGGNELRERALNEYPPDKVSAITGITVADIERLARLIARARLERGGPSFIRLNYGLQRHGGGAMAVRTIVALPAITGEWRYPGGGALLSTSAQFPFINDSVLTRPDLIPPGTRTINMVELGKALNGELSGPPVKAVYVYNSNPAAVCPDQASVLRGLRREDLFTVVHEQFQTDTADYADIVLPATTQLEHWDVHGAYGHLYVQVNTPAIAPLGEAKPNTEVFRLLARRMNLPPELFAATDEQLIEEALQPPTPKGPLPRPEAFDGITFERLKNEGPIRVNVPKQFTPFAEGNFGTKSGKCELFSPRLEARGHDPLPTYTPPHEDPQTQPELAARYPLQMVCPPHPSFLNSTFVNVPALRERAVEPTVEIHPDDATRRGIVGGEMVRVYNDRGSFQARALVGPTVKLGVVVTLGVWWNKYAADGVNCNVTTSSRITDYGAGATFFDNLVEVALL